MNEERFYTIKSFYKSRSVAESIVEEKKSFWDYKTPLEKKGKETQFMAKEYIAKLDKISDAGPQYKGNAKVVIYNYGILPESIKVYGWVIPTKYDIKIHLTDCKYIFVSSCRFECINPNGKSIKVSIQMKGSFSFLYRLWAGINYLLLSDPDSIPADCEIEHKIIEKAFI